MIRGSYRFSLTKNKEEQKLGKCCMCRLRKNCELLDAKVTQKLHHPEIEVPDYVMTDRENCALSNHRIFTYDENVEYVSDGIRDHYKIDLNKYNCSIKANSDGFWEPCQPVYISAPTGKGKNTFIEETLFPYVKKLNREKNTNKKVLVISNRIALRTQMENRIKNGIDSKEFNPNSINKLPKFADVADVMLYQGILNNQKHLEQIQQDIMSSYLFVVCDEAHFFTSDSSFNPYTAKILNAIVKTFKNAIRVYMTATPYDCIEYIENAEQKNRCNDDISAELGVCYHFKRNYDFLDTKYYSNRDELKELIVKSNEKWLIFIDNKNLCDDFKKKLEAEMKAEEVLAISADSKSDPTYQKMIVEEKFFGKTRVVIATSVIDNGVNFRGVQNVVLSDISRVKCLQMLGRARLDNSESRITLYLNRFGEKLIEKRLDYLEEQYDAYNYYATAYEQFAARSVNQWTALSKYYDNQPKDWEHAKRWFGRDINNPEKVYPNEIARSLVKKYIPLYESILKEMRKNNKEPEVPGQEYLEHQLSWFGKTYIKDNDINLTDTKEIERQKIEKGKKVLFNFLELYIREKISRDMQGDFRKKFTKKHDTVFEREDKNKDREYGCIKINKILQNRDLPYYVSNKNREHWEVIRIEDDPNKPYVERVREALSELKASKN